MIWFMLAMHYEKLQIWQKAMDLARRVYAHVKNFPKEEMYGLCSQMRRAAVSIPSNIAEGSQKGGNVEFAHFILISRGSLAELDTQLILSRDFGYISVADAASLRKEIDELSRMLHSFHSKLKTRNS